jgi:starch synthase
MKGGLITADAITAVSPNFARELMTPDGGFDMDPIMRSRSHRVRGIVNGIDTAVWNPATDTKIPTNYDIERLRRKTQNRRALLSLCGMDKDDPGIVIGVVSRLTAQKGIDLLMPVLGDLIGRGIRFIVLGSGDEILERQIFVASQRGGGRFWGYVGFNDELAHLIEAGCDAFLMPSRFEPCGLSQLYSLAYGTPPIVRRVGGLVDTVRGYDGDNLETANGFSFDAANPVALRQAVLWARSCYRDPRIWTPIVRNGMSGDYSWERSASQYAELYRETRTR